MNEPLATVGAAQQAGVPWLQGRRGKAGVVEFFGVMGAMQMRDFRVLSLMAGSYTADAAGDWQRIEEVLAAAYSQLGQR